jgi:hypothetical protein
MASMRVAPPRLAPMKVAFTTSVLGSAEGERWQVEPRFSPCQTI